MSIWQVLYNPAAGPGNVMFLQSPDLTGGAVRIYSDNLKLVRWVQDEIPLDATDLGSSATEATFAYEGSVGSSLTEFSTRLIAADACEASFDNSRLDEVVVMRTNAVLSRCCAARLRMSQAYPQQSAWTLS